MSAVRRNQGTITGDLDTPGPNDAGVMPLMPDFSSGTKRLLIDGQDADDEDVLGQITKPEGV